MKQVILLLPFIFSIIAGLSLKTTDSNYYCFMIKGKEGQYLHFSYLVRGRNEDNVALKVNIIKIIKPIVV